MSDARPGPRLFGTDGVRGVANDVLTPELALRLGRAGGRALALAGPPYPALIGRDTRRSGDMLADALSAGLMSVGIDVHDAGICPTPGVAYLVATAGYLGGAVVSASHNPFADNGIKFFGPDGAKLSDDQEDAIETALHRVPDGLPRPVGPGVGRRTQHTDLSQHYAEHVISTARHRPLGIKVVLDCAHGATAGLAADIFGGLGATIDLIGASPDGTNINDGVGSTHPATLARAVVERGADVGFAFDGDGDRIIAVDETGRIVDGDGLLAICALDLLRRGALPGKAIAATVMSNFGLDAALAAAGGKVVRTPVGDRYVAQAMREHGLLLGGEQAGHIIFLAHNTTGDGMITAIQVLDILVDRGVSLGEATRGLVWYPQEHRTVRFTDRADAARALERQSVRQACAAVEASLAGQGRVVLRASGTEPLVRILVEAPSQAIAQRAADDLEEAIGQKRD